MNRAVDRGTLLVHCVHAFDRFTVPIRPGQVKHDVHDRWGYRIAKERYVCWKGLGRIDFMYHRANVTG